MNISLFERKPKQDGKKELREYIDLTVTRVIDKYSKNIDEVLMKAEKKLEKSFSMELKRLILADCRTCKAKILVRDGGWYRDYKGRVFCSHECIDNFKEYSPTESEVSDE